jgi:hypothetical protein
MNTALKTLTHRALTGWRGSRESGATADAHDIDRGS